MQEEKNIRTHIAIIMDGNRRWAKNKKIDEVIDYNVINDEKNMDFHFTMFDIGEES